MYWLTSDTHFNHTNIIRYCSRPFSSTDEMNEIMVKNWNSNVGKNDIVIHHGDFAFCKSEDDLKKIRGRLNGQIHLIVGNHDRFISGFDKVFSGYTTLRPKNNIFIVSCHFPFAVWDHKHHGAIHCHGHCHGRYNGVGRIFDVGVDTNNFSPISMDYLIEKMEQIEP